MVLVKNILFLRRLYENLTIPTKLIHLLAPNSLQIDTNSIAPVTRVSVGAYVSCHLQSTDEEPACRMHLGFDRETSSLNHARPPLGLRRACVAPLAAHRTKVLSAPAGLVPLAPVLEQNVPLALMFQEMNPMCPCT